VRNAQEWQATKRRLRRRENIVTIPHAETHDDPSTILPPAPVPGRRRHPGRRALLASTAVGTAALASVSMAAPAFAKGSDKDGSDAGGDGKVKEARFGVKGFTNPVIDTSQADPGVIRTHDGYYLYSTNGDLGRLPIFFSKDLVDWDFVADGMPDLAPWAESGKHWAPEVMEIDGKYHVYYSAHDKKNDVQAIGVAVADSPEGPFIDESSSPMISMPDQDGCLDASPFRDRRNQMWLLWTDGNSNEKASFIYAQRLSDDGMHVIGGPTRILARDKDWETFTIEGPSVIEYLGQYYLFYSGGEFWKESYGVGVAVAKDIEGPWEKLGDEPVLSSNDLAVGTGHGTPIRTGLEFWYIYHAWQPGHVNEAPGRQVWLSHMDLSRTHVSIDGPLTDNPRRPPVRIF
jgi:beta-xylosidase